MGRDHPARDRKRPPTDDHLDGCGETRGAATRRSCQTADLPGGAAGASASASAAATAGTATAPPCDPACGTGRTPPSILEETLTLGHLQPSPTTSTSSSSDASESDSESESVPNSDGGSEYASDGDVDSEPKAGEVCCVLLGRLFYNCLVNNGSILVGSIIFSHWATLEECIPGPVHTHCPRSHSLTHYLFAKLYVTVPHTFLLLCS